MATIKRDATTGRPITKGQLYRTYYRGTPHECYSVVEDPERERPTSGESLTQRWLAEHPDQADRVPAIEVME